MEEAVTRKFVHEESGSITSLCGSVFIIISYNYFFAQNKNYALLLRRLVVSHFNTSVKMLIL